MSSTLVLQCPMFFSPFILEKWYITVPSLNANSRTSWTLCTWNLGLVKKSEVYVVCKNFNLWVMLYSGPWLPNLVYFDLTFPFYLFMYLDFCFVWYSINYFKAFSLYHSLIFFYKIILIKGAEATCVEIVTEMKKCFRLKDMLNFNIRWNF